VGSMGALLALRYATGASAPISFPWSEAGARIFQSKQTLSIDSQKQQQQQHQQEEEEQLTVPGLQNVGNNCFLNVVLQVSTKLLS
jgi:ubiquitin C-terminal hydrolase